MKKNQKGFTLVELVVVMAILSIIGIAIYGFFHTSSTAYNKTGAEVDLQYEAQLTLNQLDNLIIDSTKQLDYYYHTVSANNQAILSDADIPPEANVTGKTFIITNEDVAYKIDWDSATKKVNLTKMTPTVSSNSLMAEYVSGFNVSLERVKSQRVVEFHFDFMNKDKQYDTAHNVTMRNKIIVNGAAVSGNKVYKWWAIDRVRIFKDGNDVTDLPIPVVSTGTEQQIELLAKVIGVNNPSQDVVWTIAGNTDSATTISGNTANPCTVILGASESSDSIIVTATAVAMNEWDKNKAKASTRIKITNETKNEEGLVRGGAFELVADQLLHYNRPIVWGFKSIKETYIGGEPHDATKKYGRRITSGSDTMVDAMWDNYYERQEWEKDQDLDSDKNGFLDYSKYYYDYSQDPDKCMVLRETSNGHCMVESGRSPHEGLLHSAVYQVEIEARVYDDDGNVMDTQSFGFGEGSQPLIMDRGRMEFTDVSGNSLSETSWANKEWFVSDSNIQIFMKPGDEKIFNITKYGFSGDVYMEPINSVSESCFDLRSVSPSGLVVLKAAKNVTSPVTIDYALGICDNDYAVESSRKWKIYTVTISVNPY